MNTSFSQDEARFLIQWAKEDHLGLFDAPARALQRRHGVHSSTLGQLVARLSTNTGCSQYEIAQGPTSEGPVTWPWPNQQVFETRLRELLPESTLDYLEELGAIATREVAATPILR